MSSDYAIFFLSSAQIKGLNRPILTTSVSEKATGSLSMINLAIHPHMYM